MTVKLTVVLALLMLAGLLHPRAEAGMLPPYVKHRDGAEFENFPLWKDVPVKAFVVAGEGRVRGTRWAAYVFRGASNRVGGQRPCIDVAHISSNGAYAYSIECGALAPAQGRDVPPVFTLSGGSHSNKPGGPIVGESFIGMTFASQVSEVQLDLSSGMSIVHRTTYLSKRQSRKAHVRRFRYIAFGLGRDVCISHVTGLDKERQTVIDADTGECRPSG
jgi:hypothetical protein